MSFKENNKHIVDVLFVIALFCLFALSALLLVLIGSNVYQKTVKNMDMNYNTRSSFSYITEKIRQSDEEGCVSLGSLGGKDALLLSSTIEDTAYSTYIYYHDGYLKELFTKADNPQLPQAGQNILPLKDFEITALSPHLYRLFVTTESDESYSMLLSIHSTQS